MKQTEELAAFSSLISLFEEDNGGPVESYMNRNYFGSGNLFISGVTNELMLRVNHPLKTLTIARIAFTHKRQGMGERLLIALKNYAKEHQFESLVIECVLTEEAFHFAQKHGFQKKEDLILFSGTERDFFGDYVMNFSNTKTLLDVV